jgi:hypothetical protein
VSVDEDITEATPLSAEQGVTAEAVVVPGLGNVVSTAYNIGSSTANNRTYTLGGFSLTTDGPWVVLIQPRQIANQELGYSDQFAVQVIRTARNAIVCRVRRLDVNSGWGQEVRLDLFVVEQRAL